MKKIFLCLLLGFVNVALASGIFTYKLEKSEKLEGTYTAEVGNGSTIHFAIIKNTISKEYSLIPFLVGQNSAVKKLDAFVAKKMFNIISYHTNNGVTTIIDYDAVSKKLRVIDFDGNSGKSQGSEQEMKLAPDNTFRLKDKTIFVFFDRKMGTFNTKTIADSSHITDIVTDVPQANFKSFLKLTSENPEAVNQQEFVKSGSISKRKGYFFDNNLVYTFATPTDTQLFRVNLKDNLFSTIAVKPEFSKDLQDVGTYFYDNKLVFSFVEKSNIKLQVFDADKGKQLNTLSLTDMNNLVKPELMSEYLKTTSKLSVISTVTINRTKSNQLAVRLDNVNENDYHYYNDWWFSYFMMDMMMQQQMMMQVRPPSVGGFGPSTPQEDFSNYFSDRKYTSIEFVLDADFKPVSQDNEETQFANIDREKYLKKYDDDKSIQNMSAEFTRDEMRGIYQNSKTKEIIIISDKL